MSKTMKSILAEEEKKEKERKVLSRDILILKLLASVTELAEINSQLVDNPSPGQRQIIKRKLKIIKNRLPRYATDIKTIINRKDISVLNMGRFLNK